MIGAKTHWPADVTFRQRPQLFWNNGRGQFVELSDSVGAPFQEPTVARAVATSDYDRDGDLDVLMTVNGGPAKLLRNDLAEEDANWIRLRLAGAAPNLEAVGAEVTVFAGELMQRRYVSTGSSYLSQSEANPVVFGLGGATGVDSVLVRWPTTGQTTRTGSLASGAEHTLREDGS